MIKFLLKLNFLFSFIFTSLLYSSNSEAYTNAVNLYHQEMYADAFPVIKKEATKGNKEAQYLLAYMYEHGLGVVENKQEALVWYKEIPSNYKYIIKDKPIDNFEQRINNQIDDSSKTRRESFIFTKLDSNMSESKSELMKMLGHNFGLLPYKNNYFIPFSYASTNYKRHTALNAENNSEYESHVETEYQLSFQKPLTFNLLGWNETVSLAYTQEVWWKLYDKSAPFRETNYRPEVFMIIPTSDSIDNSYNLKSIKLGYRHESNGQEGYQSRSWNRLFLATQWQWKNLFVKAEGWYRIPEDEDDNPDIIDYMGYGDLQMTYLFDKDQVNLLLRNNFKLNENRGAIEIDYSTPFLNSTNTYLYVKLFSGYGESMISYDENVNKISIGFSFSRSIF